MIFTSFNIVSLDVPCVKYMSLECEKVNIKNISSLNVLRRSIYSLNDDVLRIIRNSPVKVVDIKCSLLKNKKEVWRFIHNVGTFFRITHPTKPYTKLPTKMKSFEGPISLYENTLDEVWTNIPNYGQEMNKVIANPYRLVRTTRSKMRVSDCARIIDFYVGTHVLGLVG